jgi:hypothetical protein
MVTAMVALIHLDAQLGAGLRFATGHATSINSKRVPQFILCPSRAICQSGIYECRECRVFVTEPDEHHLAIIDGECLLLNPS